MPNNKIKVVSRSKKIAVCKNKNDKHKWNVKNIKSNQIRKFLKS